jgi:outer membrane protein assembly factor BamA
MNSSLCLKISIPIVNYFINGVKRIVILFAFLHSGFTVNAQFKKDSTEKSLRIAAMPMINYNRTQGVIVGAMTQAYYKLNKNDTVSPESSTGLMAIYTAEKTWLVGIGQQLYLNQDRWRIRTFLVKGDANYQYFNGDANTNAGQYEDYSNDVTMIMGQVQRKIWRRIYAGFCGEYNTTKTYFASHADSLDERKLSNLGYLLSNDSRNNIQYPATGIFMNFKNQFYREWTGSDNDFIRYQINYTQFFNLLKDQRHILLARASMDIATGDVPFQAQGIVGRDDLRGYSQGQFRGNQVYAVQSEYRWMFDNSRFGLVGFAGVASAVESFSDIFKTALLPGVGAGLRFRLIPDLKINIGVDVGFGKNDYSLTFRIGEAFAR